MVTLAVLGDDGPHWRPQSFGYTLWGFSVNVTFPVGKLLDYAEQWQQMETHANPIRSQRAWRSRRPSGISWTG